MSSAQPRDLTSLIQRYQPDLVIVKLYQRFERITAGWTPAMTQQWSLDQLQSAKDNGCLRAGYWWPYTGRNVRADLDDTLILADRAGDLVLPPFSDAETYDGTIPTRQELLTIADEYERQHLAGHFYSNRTMWERANGPSLPDSFGWVATYVNTEPADLDAAPGFGDLQIIGWQWTSDGVDQSLMLVP